MSPDDLPPLRQIDRQSLFDLLPLLVALFLFALSGATGHMLRTWTPRQTWQRRGGEIIASISATVCAGLGLASFQFFQTKLGLLLAISGLASWAGSAFIDLATRRLLAYVADLELKNGYK